MSIYPPATRSRIVDPIEVWALSRNEWRISDTRVATGDAGSVLGFVERTSEGRYEVLELGSGRADREHGLQRHGFDNFDEVIEHFRRGARR